MKYLQLSIIFTLIIFIFYLNFSCVSKVKDNTSKKNDTISIVDNIKIDYLKDSSLDQISALLAGDHAEIFEKIFSDQMSFWNDFKTASDTPWVRITNERLLKMDDWSKNEISPKINDTALLFYPFSGPDFLNAYHIFPNANEYVFVAMEKLGTIPNLFELKENDIKDYLEAVNFGLRDIFKRSYFITGNMNNDLRKNKVDGVLPLLFVFLNRTNHEIFEYAYYRLEDDGETFTKIDAPSNSLETVECVKMKILKKGDNKLKDFYYFYADISNEGFKKTPQLLKYLQNLRPSNSFIKSASYLSHYETFSEIRNVVLNNSNAVLEDDTGIPFKYFIAEFSHFLYGKYEKPINDFQPSSLFQKDLDEAFKTEEIKDLNFNLGYHWRSKNQNWMLFVKKQSEN